MRHTPHRIEFVGGPKGGDTRMYREKQPAQIQAVLPSPLIAQLTEGETTPDGVEVNYGTYEERYHRFDHFERWSIYEWTGTAEDRRKRSARESYGRMLTALDDLQRYASGTHLEQHRYVIDGIRRLINDELGKELAK